jgi:hypothetical protein
MPGFEEAWSAVATHDGESVSPELQPLLQRVYLNVLSKPLDLVQLKKNLEELLEFLAGEGRTNANCWAVDLFFLLSERWERPWEDQDLPEGFHDVLSRMGDALHDTVRTPAIAQNFECLPEQLLDQVRRLRIDATLSDKS